MQFFILGIISALMNLSMYLFGNVDYLLKAFFSVIVIDFLTGILRAIKRREFSFSVVILGFIKNLGIWLLLLLLLLWVVFLIWVILLEIWLFIRLCLMKLSLY